MQNLLKTIYKAFSSELLWSDDENHNTGTCLLSSSAQTELRIDMDRPAGCSSDDAGEENVSESAMRASVWRCSSGSFAVQRH